MTYRVILLHASDGEVPVVAGSPTHAAGISNLKQGDKVKSERLADEGHGELIH